MLKPIILFLAFSAHNVFAASVIEQNGDIIVNQNGELKKIRLPYELQRTGSFVLHLEPKKPSQFAGGNGGGGGSGNGNGFGGNGEHAQASNLPPASLSTLLYRAKRLFAARKYDEAMTVLDTAEQVAPKDAQVKTMKGSLFFMRGMKEEALKFWQESLAINPDQPAVKAHLQKLGVAAEPAAAKEEETTDETQ